MSVRQIFDTLGPWTAAPHSIHMYKGVSVIVSVSVSVSVKVLQ